METTIIDEINSLVKFEERTFNEVKGKLDEDAEYNFAWMGEQFFKSAFKLKTLKNIQLNLEKDPKYLNWVIEWMTGELINRHGSLMDRSTGQLHSLTSLWKKEIYQVLLMNFKTITNK